MTNQDSILKSREITLLTKVCLVKAMVFPEVIYGCESWAIKKAEHQRINAFELWCWRRLLRVPWTAKRSSLSVLKEINPEYSLEGTDAEAETPILWPCDAKNWLIGKDPGAGQDCRQEEKGMTEDEMVGWHHPLNRHEFEQALGGGEGQGSLSCCFHGIANSQTGLSDWTTKIANTYTTVSLFTFLTFIFNSKKGGLLGPIKKIWHVKRFVNNFS